MPVAWMTTKTSWRRGNGLHPEIELGGNESLSLQDRIMAMKEARNQAYREIPKRRVQHAIRSNKRQYIDAADIVDGAEIYLYRDLTKRKNRSQWEGPYLKVGGYGRLVLALKVRKVSLVHASR